MPERKAATQTMKVTDARQQFSDIINRVHNERRRVLIEKQGIPVAAIISTRDLERFDWLEAQRAERFKALELTGDTFKDTPTEELDREVAAAISRGRRDTSRKRAGRRTRK
jgi:prevent-host-death family protein